MIDAYEIGIQLLLQEDVSAGLAVINRGLADVDRAIAATSANLSGLVQTAERAAKAVSAASGGRVPQIVASESKAAAAPAEAMPRVTKDIRPSPSVAPAETGAQLGPASPAAPNREAPVRDGPSAQAVPKVATTERPDTASAPSRAGGGEAEGVVRRELPSLGSQPTIAPVVPIEPVASPTDLPRRHYVNAATPHDGGRRREPAVASATVAITAAIGRTRAAMSAPAPRDQAALPSQLQTVAGRQRAAASPWSGIAAAATSSPVQTTERAAAPQTAGRERSEGGGGTVMLDGRLVGQWLSEHMAREASRPPGGTSFFDARQTPAWNVSGAL